MTIVLPQSIVDNKFINIIIWLISFHGVELDLVNNIYLLNLPVSHLVYNYSACLMCLYM